MYVTIYSLSHGLLVVMLVDTREDHHHHYLPFTWSSYIQADIVSKVQNELAAHVSALEEKKEIAETVEDIIDFEDYMADASDQPITITGMFMSLSISAALRRRCAILILILTHV